MILLMAYPLALLGPILSRTERIIVGVVSLADLVAQYIECLKHGDILKQF